LNGIFDEDFPNVQKLLTKAEYEKLKMTYLEKFPSVSFNLRHLGSRFPNFIKKNSKLTGKKMPVVYDAALFDWGKMEAFELAHKPSILIEDISKPRFSTKKLYLQPHVRLLKLKYSIDLLNKESSILKKEVASNVAQKNTKVAKEQTRLSLTPKKTFLALHRYQGNVFVKNLTELEFKILNNFQAGYSIKNFAEDALKKYKGMGDQDLQKHFNQLMSLGWLYLKIP
jgi:hypothetical protein